MEDEKRTGGPGLSRTPRTPGKLPRVSVSLPEALNAVVLQEAQNRGISVSKYLLDLIDLTHDNHGLNMPVSQGSADLSQVMGAINALAGEVRGVKTDVQDMKNIVYALPSGSAAQRSTIQKSLLPAYDESLENPEQTSEMVRDSAALETVTPEPVKEEVDHSAAPEEVQEKTDGEEWIKGADMKTYFEYTGRSDIFSKMLKRLRESGDLIAEERGKPGSGRWFYSPASVKKFIEMNPGYLNEKAQ